jgi:hypothetical protein
VRQEVVPTGETSSDTVRVRDESTDANEAARYPSRMLLLGAVALGVVVLAYSLRHQSVPPAASPEARVAKAPDKSERIETTSKSQPRASAPQREDSEAPRLKEQKIGADYNASEHARRSGCSNCHREQA